MTTAAPDVGGRQQSAGHAHVHPSLALLVIATAQLMVILDATIVNIALPSIQHDLNFTGVGLSWVLNAYTLVFGGLLLLGGRAGDLFGRRRMFIAGVLIFAVASLLGGFAWDKDWLLAMRALQGVGGAIASPTALSLITSTFDEGPDRNRAFGVYAAVSGAGAAIGLILGGLLTDYVSWRWVFFVNAPIGIGLAIATPFVLAESERGQGRFALPDAVTSTLGMGSLVYGFIHAATDGWGDTVTIGAFALAVVLLGTFVGLQARAEQPLMPLRLFRDPSRVGSYVVMLVTGAAMFGMFFFLTQYIQDVLGFSPIKAGLAFLPVSVTIVVVAQIVSRLVQRISPRYLLGTGTVLAGIGLYSLSRLTVDSSYAAHVLPSLVIIAAGMGSVFVPITLTAVAGVDRSETGIASAMLNVGQQVGGTLGVASLSTVAAHASPGYADLIHFSPVAFTDGATAAFFAGSLFAVVGLVAALVLVRLGPQDAAAAEALPGG